MAPQEPKTARNAAVVAQAWKTVIAVFFATSALLLLIPQLILNYRQVVAPEMATPSWASMENSLVWLWPVGFTLWLCFTNASRPSTPAPAPPTSPAQLARGRVMLKRVAIGIAAGLLLFVGPMLYFMFLALSLARQYCT